VHHVGILYDQFMMHGQRNIKFPAMVFSYKNTVSVLLNYISIYLWVLYAFFCVICWHLNLIYQHFRIFCLFHLHMPGNYSEESI